MEDNRSYSIMVIEKLPSQIESIVAVHCVTETQYNYSRCQNLLLVKDQKSSPVKENCQVSQINGNCRAIGNTKRKVIFIVGRDNQSQKNNQLFFKVIIVRSDLSEK